MRRAAKRDSSEPDIIDALRKCGWSVLQVSVKDGPDLVIGRWGRTHLAEVKTGKAKLKPGQLRWAAEWQGARPLVFRSVEDVLSLDRIGRDLALAKV